MQAPLKYDFLTQRVTFGLVSRSRRSLTLFTSFARAACQMSPILYLFSPTTIAGTKNYARKSAQATRTHEINAKEISSVRSTRRRRTSAHRPPRDWQHRATAILTSCLRCGTLSLRVGVPTSSDVRNPTSLIYGLDTEYDVTRCNDDICGKVLLFSSSMLLSSRLAAVTKNGSCSPIFWIRNISKTIILFSHMYNPHFCFSQSKSSTLASAATR